MGKEALKIAQELNNEGEDAQSRVEELEDEVCMLKDKIAELEYKLKRATGRVSVDFETASSAIFEPVTWRTR